jgi:hypothetical protein
MQADKLLAGGCQGAASEAREALTRQPWAVGRLTLTDGAGEHRGDRVKFWPLA